jgi:hypothetical protein
MSSTSITPLSRCKRATWGRSPLPRGLAFPHLIVGGDGVGELSVRFVDEPDVLLGPVAGLFPQKIVVRREERLHKCELVLKPRLAANVESVGEKRLSQLCFSSRVFREIHRVCDEVLARQVEDFGDDAVELLDDVSGWFRTLGVRRAQGDALRALGADDGTFGGAAQVPNGVEHAVFHGDRHEQWQRVVRARKVEEVVDA